MAHKNTNMLEIEGEVYPDYSGDNAPTNPSTRQSLEEYDDADQERDLSVSVERARDLGGTMLHEAPSEDTSLEELYKILDDREDPHAALGGGVPAHRDATDEYVRDARSAAKLPDTEDKPQAKPRLSRDEQLALNKQAVRDIRAGRIPFAQS